MPQTGGTVCSDSEAEELGFPWGWSSGKGWGAGRQAAQCQALQDSRLHFVPTMLEIPGEHVSRE